MSIIRKNPRMLEEVAHFFLSDSCCKTTSRKMSGRTPGYFAAPGNGAVPGNGSFRESGGKKNTTWDSKIPPVGVVIIDKNRIMRFANPVAKSMLELKDEDVGQLFNFYMAVNEVLEVSIVREDRKHGIASMHIGETEWCNEFVYFAVMRDVTRSWRKKGRVS